MTVSAHVRHTVDSVRASARAPLEKAEALVEMAFDLQVKPKSAADLADALYLYDEAMKLAQEHPLARARALAGRGAALRRMPGIGLEALEEARACFAGALEVMRNLGDAEEVAEVEMSYGLVVQALSAHARASLDEAVKAYHRALRFFTRGTHPREFATLHNNLATAYLSMKLAPEKDVMREALAVQSFQEALKVVTLLEDPTEYAMLQNNLGNALQAMRERHPIENLTRAVAAYDEALRVRTEYDMPLEYANTLSNKANALMNLPDDIEHPELGNPANLVSAARLLETARDVFEKHGVHDRARVVEDLRASLVAEVAQKGSA